MIQRNLFRNQTGASRNIKGFNLITQIRFIFKNYEDELDCITKLCYYCLDSLEFSAIAILYKIPMPFCLKVLLCTFCEFYIKASKIYIYISIFHVPKTSGSKCVSSYLKLGREFKCANYALCRPKFLVPLIIFLQIVSSWEGLFCDQKV